MLACSNLVAQEISAVRFDTIGWAFAPAVAGDSEVLGFLSWTETNTVGQNVSLLWHEYDKFQDAFTTYAWKHDDDDASGFIRSGRIIIDFWRRFIAREKLPMAMCMRIGSYICTYGPLDSSDDCKFGWWASMSLDSSINEDSCVNGKNIFLLGLCRYPNKHWL